MLDKAIPLPEGEVEPPCGCPASVLMHSFTVSSAPHQRLLFSVVVVVLFFKSKLYSFCLSSCFPYLYLFRVGEYVCIWAQPYPPEMVRLTKLAQLVDTVPAKLSSCHNHCPSFSSFWILVSACCILGDSLHHDSFS